MQPSRVLSTLLAGGIAIACAVGQESPTRLDRRLPLAKLRQIRAALESSGLYTKITPQNRNDWMRVFPEDGGQSFNLFVRRNPTPLEDARRRFYIINLAPASPAVGDAALLAKDFLAACFVLQPAEVTVSLPEQLPTNEQGRINAFPLVNKVLPACLVDTAKLKKITFHDAAGFVAITDRDLYFDDPDDEPLDFVFGLSGTAAQVTVFSTRRLGDPAASDAARALFTRRVLGIAVHEFGHNCGLPHCTLHRCLMNGANGLHDMDGAPVLFCPDCLAKLWWCLALDPREHLQQMLKVARAGELEKVLAAEIKVLEASLKVVAEAAAK